VVARDTTTLFAALNMLTGVVIGRCRHRHVNFPTRLCPERGLAAHLVIFFDADRPPGASGGQVGLDSSACFEPGVIYVNGSFAGPQIVLNGGAVTVKATPLRGRLHAEH
jgi:hypothetical protein